jgi:hypothetical protein
LYKGSLSLYIQICTKEACPFIFNVHWFREFQRWGLKAHSGKRQHCGHVHPEEEHVKCATSKFLKAAEQILINQGNAACLTPSAMQTLVFQNSGVVVSINQIEHACQVDEVPGYEVVPSTSAGEFIKWLKSNPKKSYILLYNKAYLGMLQVRQPGRLQCTIRRANSTNNEVHDVTIPNTGDKVDGPDAYVERVRQALKIPNTQKLLLAVAWCTDEERRMATHFPEIMGIDVTEQMNNEKRPLLVLGGLTNVNKNFMSCQAFLPSQQRWVLDWFLSTALP